jgi:dihydroorotase (multifunctional complex type)
VTQHIFIQNGWISQQKTAAPSNILIAGERIVAVGPDVEPIGDALVVDAGGLLILPGLVDAHVHLREPGGEHKEDLTSGTQAALAGGVTTVLAMPNTSPPITDHSSLANIMAMADAKAVCDFGFFVGATSTNAKEAASLSEAVGLKIYMGSSTGTLLVDQFEGQFAHFRACPPPRPIAVHAEDEAAVQWFAQHGQRRPPLCAALETARALVLAEHTGKRLHICHLSTAQELQLVRSAKARGIRVSCEVTPHHLFLTEDDERRLGPLAKMNPPLRSSADRDALWDDLAFIDAIASDHAPHTRDEKQVSVADAPSGVPGLETTLPLMLTATSEGRMLLSDLVRLTSTGPAVVFGLRRKGDIAPGYDADLVLVSPDVEWTIRDESLRTKCGWTPFAGSRVKGRVERVYLRGTLAYADGEILVEPGYGRAVEFEDRGERSNPS